MNMGWEDKNSPKADEIIFSCTKRRQFYILSYTQGFNSSMSMIEKCYHNQPEIKTWAENDQWIVLIYQEYLQS